MSEKNIYFIYLLICQRRSKKLMLKKKKCNQMQCIKGLQPQAHFQYWSPINYLYWCIFVCKFHVWGWGAGRYFFVSHPVRWVRVLFKPQAGLGKKLAGTALKQSNNCAVAGLRWQQIMGIDWWQSSTWAQAWTALPKTINQA